MKTVQLNEMKTVQLNENINTVLNELSAQVLEKVCTLYGHEVNINDTEWQAVYDLKEHVFNSIEQLGLIIENG